MDTQTARRFDMLKRVKQFGLAHAGDFPETSLGQQLFATLDELVSTLESLGVNYLSGLGAARSGVVTKSVARTALVNALIAIQRTSRSLVYDIPGLTGKFPQPRGLNDQTLLTTARSYAQAVTPHKDRFIRHELAADFLEQLLQHIATFAAAVTDKQAAVGVHRSARVGIDNKILDGVQTVRQLDALIRNKYRGETVVLAEWQHAARVTRRVRTPDVPFTEEEMPAATTPQK